jgi:hypothetical protein
MLLLLLLRNIQGMKWFKGVIIKRVAGADFNCKVGWTSCLLSDFAETLVVRDWRINLHCITNDSRVAAWKLCHRRI